MGRVNVGNMRQRVRITGSTLIDGNPPGNVNRANSGLFAQNLTNVGQYERDRTIIMPELNVNMSYALTNSLDITVGYTMIYFNEVALAGDHMSRNVNTDLLDGTLNAGPADPGFNFSGSDYWIHAINIGLAARF